MDCQIPTIRSNRKGLTTLATLASLSDLVAPHTVNLTLDFSKTKFLAANMTSPLGAIIARMEQILHMTIELNVASMSTPLHKVLSRNRFLTNHRHPAPTDRFRTTMPYQTFQTHDEDKFESYVDQQLDRQELQQFKFEAGPVLERTVFEVFQNAVQHSSSRVGIFVCGQFFPRQGSLLFSISDAGIGIRDNVRKYYDLDHISSVSALRWALEESNTTKQGCQPGGLGLHELKNAIHMNGGAIMIASRLAYYEYRNGQETFKELSADFPGTSVTIEIKTEGSWISSLDDDGDIPF